MLEIEVFSHSRPRDLSPLFTVDMPTARQQSDADHRMPCRRHAGGTTRSRAHHIPILIFAIRAEGQGCLAGSLADQQEPRLR
jgi:hypothetical protein